MADWQPIDTAPKDGRWFCACDSSNAHAYRARWNGREYESEDEHISMKLRNWWTGRPPEMWTYLPDPPWMVPLPAPRPFPGS